MAMIERLEQYRRHYQLVHGREPTAKEAAEWFRYPIARRETIELALEAAQFRCGHIPTKQDIPVHGIKEVNQRCIQHLQQLLS